MDDSLASLAVALAAARESDLLAGLQLSEAQRSLGLSPQLVFLAVAQINPTKHNMHV